MMSKLIALAFGGAFGFILAWARLTDPMVIRRMLRLQEPDVFLLMGAAIVVASISIRVLRALRMRSLVGGEPVGWTTSKVAKRHVAGSVIFGIGWSIAATCPGPMLAMIGQGRLGGLFVAAGVFVGLTLQGAALRGRRRGSALEHTSATSCV
jgi:uncharacterized protein